MCEIMMLKAIFGVIYIFLAQSWALDSLTVTLTKEFTKPGDEISLICEGNSNQLVDYILNQIEWRFTDANGEETRLSEGFFAEHGSPNLFHGPQARYIFNYRPTSKTYEFKITITNITYEDDGIYTCSLLDHNGGLIYEQSKRLTVQQPVDTLTLSIGIYDLHTEVLLTNKTTDIQDSDPPLKLKQGHYRLVCDAVGNNPNASVDLLYNDQPLTYSVTSNINKDNAGDGPSYTITFDVANVALKTSEQDQYLTCSANLTGNVYVTKRTGMKIVVTSEPNINCTNYVFDDQRGEIHCEISYISEPGDSLKCEEVKWVVGGIKQTINSIGRWDGAPDIYGIIESFCKPDGDTLDVTLVITTPHQMHVDTVIILSYGERGEGQRHHIVFGEKEPMKTTATHIKNDVVNQIRNEMHEILDHIKDSIKRIDDTIVGIEEKANTREERIGHVNNKVINLEIQRASLRDEIVNLQWQSMRNNLIFGNIPETESEKSTEDLLRSFLIESMMIAKPVVDKILFERVDRIGSNQENRHRDILAKFILFKDKEYVRKQSETLQDPDISVHEQFPGEIDNEKIQLIQQHTQKSQLIKQLNKAQNEGKSAWIAYDTLYIDGKPIR